MGLMWGRHRGDGGRGFSQLAQPGWGGDRGPSTQRPCWGAGGLWCPPPILRGLGRNSHSLAFPGPVPRLPAFQRLPWELWPPQESGSRRGRQKLPGEQDPHPEEGSQRCHPSPHLRRLRGCPSCPPTPGASPHGQPSTPGTRSAQRGPRRWGIRRCSNVTIKAPMAAWVGVGGTAGGSGPSGNLESSLRPFPVERQHDSVCLLSTQESGPPGLGVGGTPGVPPWVPSGL